MDWVERWCLLPPSALRCKVRNVINLDELFKLYNVVELNSWWRGALKWIELSPADFRKRSSAPAPPISHLYARGSARTLPDLAQTQEGRMRFFNMLLWDKTISNALHML